MELPLVEGTWEEVQSGEGLTQSEEPEEENSGRQQVKGLDLADQPDQRQKLLARDGRRLRQVGTVRSHVLEGKWAVGTAWEWQ